jgi:hypothetical protein
MRSVAVVPGLGLFRTFPMPKRAKLTTLGLTLGLFRASRDARIVVPFRDSQWQGFQMIEVHVSALLDGNDEIGEEAFTSGEVDGKMVLEGVKRKELRSRASVPPGE